MFILKMIGTFILDYLLRKFSTFISDLLKKVRKRDEIAKKADESVEPLKKAETAAEIDDAARGALDGF